MALRLDTVLNMPRRIDDFRRIEYGRMLGDSGPFGNEHRVRGEQGLKEYGVGIVPAQDALSDAGRAIAQPDIAIASAGITELGKSAMLMGDDEVGGCVSH